jgi:hypothetical protein
MGAFYGYIIPEHLLSEVRLHEHFTAVVHISFVVIVGVVVDMLLARFGASRNLRDGSLKMRSPLVLTLFRRSTLGMCHCNIF